jgi:SPOR domain
MSMAEDTHKRSEFLTDSYPPKAKDPAGDPLAELARLIGQSDPFAEQSRASAPKPLDAFRTDGRPAPEWLSRPAPASERDETEYAQPHAPRDDYHAEQEPAPYEPQTHEYRQPDAAVDARYEQGQDQAHQHAEAPAYRAVQDDDLHYQGGDDRYRVTPPTPGDYDPDSYYAEDGHMPPQPGEENAPNRRRGMMLTIAAVLGLAVIGTAGAFGYRAYTSGASAPATPPVIKADTTPAKIVPPPANTDAQGKPFQDRIGAPAAAPERMVSREEQPVSLPTPTRSVAPPAGFAPAASAPLVPPQPPAAAANEPKRVKTIPIRLDSDPTSATSPLAAAPSSAPPAAATRSATPKQQGGAGPMPIAPQTDPSAKTKVASRSSPAAPAGAYVVQVSAQRTEAEAMSSYRAMQQKYPTVLASREANIRRVDLGDKGGIFYRAQVGSFATSEQATAFCDDLKAAGGQCIVVQR